MIKEDPDSIEIFRQNIADHLLSRQDLVGQTGAARSDPGFCESRHTLLDITTVYCHRVILDTWRFQLDFVAAGDIGTLDIDGLNLSIDLDSKLNITPPGRGHNLPYNTFPGLSTNHSTLDGRTKTKSSL